MKEIQYEKTDISYSSTILSLTDKEKQVVTLSSFPVEFYSVLLIFSFLFSLFPKNLLHEISFYWLNLIFISAILLVLLSVFFSNIFVQKSVYIKIPSIINVKEVLFLAFMVFFFCIQKKFSLKR